jgi:hypothetical protein
MADNFDLQGWMREQKQGPYAGAKGAEKISFTSPKPKSKTGLNESLMGMIDLQPVGHLSEEYDEMYEDDDIPTNDQDYTTQPGYVHEDESMEEGEGMDLADKWDKMTIDEKEGILDHYAADADYAYMGWNMLPGEIKDKIGHLVLNAPSTEPEPDEDEKMAAMAMKQAKKGAKAVKGLNPEKDIYDLLYGDEEDDNF